MTGPEHYREAERLMDAAIGKPNGGDLVQLAQVHATLALTAAVAAPRDLGPVEAWGGQALAVNEVEWAEATS